MLDFEVVGYDSDDSGDVSVTVTLTYNLADLHVSESGKNQCLQYAIPVPDAGNGMKLSGYVLIPTGAGKRNDKSALKSNQQAVKKQTAKRAQTTTTTTKETPAPSSAIEARLSKMEAMISKFVASQTPVKPAPAIVNKQSQNGKRKVVSVEATL